LYEEKKTLLNEELIDSLNNETASLTCEDAKTIFPDIIVYHRMTNDNLLVAKVKKSTTAMFSMY
jgi:hypothetical protein